MGSLCSEPRDRPAAPRGLASNPVRSSGHMASLSSVGVQLHCRWPSRRAAPGPRCGTASGRAQGARRAQRRQNKGAESARGPRGHRGAGAKGLGSERDRAARGRAASPPRPAPQSPLSSRSRSGGPRDTREGPQLAVPARPSRRTLSPPLLPQPEVHTKRGARQAHTSHRAGPRAGPAHSAAPALKHPPFLASTAHARPWGGVGPKTAGAHPTPLAGAMAGVPAVAARASCSCQGPRCSGRRPGCVQDPSAVHSRGR